MKYTSYEEFEKANKFGTGEPNVAYAKYFIGKSFLTPLNRYEQDNASFVKCYF